MQSETPLEQSEKRGDGALNRLVIIISERRAERQPASLAELGDRGNDRAVAILPFAAKLALRISLAHQQATQPEKYQLRLAADDVPEQAHGFIAVNLAQRRPGAGIQ
jgi:hypothetical protein